MGGQKATPSPVFGPLPVYPILLPVLCSQLLSFSFNAVVPVVLNMTDYHVNHPYGMSNFALSLKFKKRKIFPVTHQWEPDVSQKALPTVGRSCETGYIVTYWQRGRHFLLKTNGISLLLSVRFEKVVEGRLWKEADISFCLSRLIMPRVVSKQWTFVLSKFICFKFSFSNDISLSKLQGWCFCVPQQTRVEVRVVVVVTGVFWVLSIFSLWSVPISSQRSELWDLTLFMDRSR